VLLADRHRSPGSSRSSLRVVVSTGAVLLALVLLSGCLPVNAASGRDTPVRRVLVLGDSITFGLYGTTPRVHEPFTRMMADRGVAVTIDGFPGETPIDTWPGHPSWLERMRWWIAAVDPDMVVIQSVLMPDPGNTIRQAMYVEVMRQLLDSAASQGAHVYLVSHPSPPGDFERQSRDIAQSLQAQAAVGRGVSTIPLDFWLDRCEGGYVRDGWHLSAKGQNCHALALTLAVDQLRAVNG
jgi:hypothetical protein